MMLAHGPTIVCPLELGLVLVGLQAVGLVACVHWPRFLRRK